MDAQFMRLRPRQDLHHREQPIETHRRNPPLLLNQRLFHHRNLRDRPAKGEETETEKAEEKAK